jgi:hypothetical protein
MNAPLVSYGFRQGGINDAGAVRPKDWALHLRSRHARRSHARKRHLSAVAKPRRGHFRPFDSDLTRRLIDLKRR